MKGFLSLPWLALTLVTCVSTRDRAPAEYPLPLDELRVRDPFIYADTTTQTYYMYASVFNRAAGEGQGVEVYKSKDLRRWSAPERVLTVSEDDWASKWVWAPEVHAYGGRYYLITTLTADDTLAAHLTTPRPIAKWPPAYVRGVQIFVADRPDGPFRRFRNAPHLRADWKTLDGTLWVEGGRPYLVFCHEWVQIRDGTIDFVMLSDDLSEIVGGSKVLFAASDAPWVRSTGGGYGYITDGCFLYRTKTGRLLMLWSSTGEDGYAIGTAISATDSIGGPWVHRPERLFPDNGGHGMLFRTFGGQLLLTLHQPNRHPEERVKFYRIEDQGDRLALGDALFDSARK